jgi:hypothetical protein
MRGAPLVADTRRTRFKKEPVMHAIGPLDSCLIAVLAVALAGTTLAAAVIEPAPSARMPRTAIVVAASWAALFVVAAVCEHDPAGSGLLLAAAQLAGAAGLWLARGRLRDDNDGGGGGGGRRGRPAPSPPCTVPDEYWTRWEQQFQPELTVLPYR